MDLLQLFNIQIPTITIDFSWLNNLINENFLVSMFYLFIYGGWIPFVLVFFMGGKLVWLDSRQRMFAKTLKFVVLAIDVPKSTEQTPKAVENIMTHLSGAKSSINWKEKWWKGHFWPPVSLEIISIEGYIQYLIRMPVKFRNVVEAAFYAQYPDAEIVEVEDYTNAVPNTYPNETHEWFGCEMRLKNPNSAYPLKTYPEFEDKISGEFKDPMNNFLESIGKLGKGEQFWMQILIIPGGDALPKLAAEATDKLLGKKQVKKKGVAEDLADLPLNIIKEMAGIGKGEEKKEEKDQFKMFNLTPTERKILEAIQEKPGKAAFTAKIRWIYHARKENFRVGNIYGQMKGFMKQYAGANSLSSDPRTITKGDYFWQKWEVPQKKRNLMNRYRSRDMFAGASPYIFNTEELATLYHFPTILEKAPLVKKTESKRAEPPSRLPVR